MTTALVSTCYGLSETFSKSNGFTKTHMKVGERKSVPNFSVRRTSTPTATTTNLSSCFSNNRLNVITITQDTAAVLVSNQTTNCHRKLDRSLSEPVDRSSIQQQQQAQRAVAPNSSRYKTELCRPYEESGKCKYGDKCQFAHGAHELRTLVRHPKYKTELCRTFHTIGFCPYGPRCHFIHNAEGPQPANGAGSMQDGPIVRPKALCFNGGSSGSVSPDGEMQMPSPPHNVNNSYFEPVTPTANNAFTFNSQDFSVLVSPPLSVNRRVQEQNAYNTALNQFTLLSNNNGHRNLNIINDMDSVFSDPPSSDLSSPPPPSSPPSSGSSSGSSDSPLGSELDELSVCGSPPGDDGRSAALRLPIFSRLSTSED